MAKKITVLSLLFVVVSVFLYSCKGETGTNGPTGAAGTSGFSTMSFQDGVYPSDAYAGTADNNPLSGLNSATNYGTSGVITLGSLSGTVFRGLIKFDLSAVVPSNLTVSEAYLTITLNAAMTNTINAYAVTSEWDELESSWTNRLTATPWTAPGGDMGLLMDSKYVGSTVVVLTLNAALVQSWISSPSTNYGIELKATDEAGGIWSNINTCESLTAASRPKLTIYYTLP